MKSVKNRDDNKLQIVLVPKVTVPPLPGDEDTVGKPPTDTVLSFPFESVDIVELASHCTDENKGANLLHQLLWRISQKTFTALNAQK